MYVFHMCVYRAVHNYHTENRNNIFKQKIMSNMKHVIITH